jgi:hypothetical protein
MNGIKRIEIVAREKKNKVLKDNNMKSLITCFVPPILKSSLNHGNKNYASSYHFLSDSFPGTFSTRSNTMTLSFDNMNDGILTSEDIFVGTILALAIAFLFSFLQGKSPSSSNIVLWQDNTRIEEDKEVSNEKIFDGDMWKEISRPENYAAYNRENSQVIRMDETEESEKNKPSTILLNRDNGSKENKLVLISLLILFVPIFSVEFFFALSRQFICGDYVTNVDDSMWIIDAKKAAAASNGSSPWAAKLCSPATII